MARAIFEIDGHVFEAELNDELAPRTVAVVKALAPFGGGMRHAIWSGPLLLVDVEEVSTCPVEDPITYLARGTIVAHPGHREVGIAYAETQFKEPTGPVYVTKVGRIVSNLDALEPIGRDAIAKGLRDFRMRLV
jgi:hypothetical protein